MGKEYEEALKNMAESLELLIPDATGRLTVCDYCEFQVEEEMTGLGLSSKVKKCSLGKSIFGCFIS